MNKSLLLAFAAGTMLVSCGGNTAKTPSADTNDDVILHAWSWSFDTIAANMRDIAEAGYAYVQTSPANTCFVGEDGGLALYSQPGDSVRGKWYYYYQPTDWKIGNYLLGSRDQFKAMMDSAAKYNVKVIVDVLPNHTAVDHTAVLPDLDNAVGGHEKLFHANGFNDITDYNDRYQCTTGKMGGLPDVNTENPNFQAYYMAYVNDLLSLGVRGFRYDTAKHIGLPSDPLDSLAERNNFWDIATGREAVKGISLGVPRDSLFIYGEVLQDRNVKEAEYGEYMDLTASAYGHALRTVLDKGDFNADSLLTWHHPVDGKHLVTWVESHDTYGNDEFKHPEVVAVNKFRRAMHGQPETITQANNGAVIAIGRGNAGLVLINLTAMPQDIDITTSLPDGDYTDSVHNSNFTVASGHVIGHLAPYTSTILIK